jgi:hypothetical protein
MSLGSSTLLGSSLQLSCALGPPNFVFNKKVGYKLKRKNLLNPVKFMVD